MLSSLLLTGPVDMLHRVGLPPGISAVIVLAVLASLVAGSVNLLWTPAQSWWASAPQNLRVIEKKVRPLSQLVERVEVLTNRTGQMAEPVAKPNSDRLAQPLATPAPSNLRSADSGSAMTVQILAQTRSAVVGILTVAILMLFLLAGGPPMLAPMSAALASDLQSTHTLRVISAVRSELRRHYTSIAMINLGLGLATSAVMTLLGMPNPFLWGTTAAVLNFIPYVGSATTLLLLTVVAFVTFDSGGHVVAVTASYLALTAIEGQIVQPLVVGRRLELNPIIAFLSLWFGGWFWGIAGVVIAVPTLIALKVVAQHSKWGQPLTECLSPTEPVDRPALSAKAKAVLGHIASKRVA